MARLKAEGRRPSKGGGIGTGVRRSAGAAFVRSLAVGILAVLAGLGGLAVWLALASAETVEDLRLAADRRAVSLEMPLPPQHPEPELVDLEEPDAPEMTATAGLTGPADLPGPQEPLEPVETEAPEAEMAPEMAEEEVLPPEPILPEEPPVEETPGAEALAALPPLDEEAELVEEEPLVLPEGPRLELIERTALGPLPRIGPAGEAPWQVYARPFDDPEDRPRLAIVVTGLGHSAAATQAAIDQLPPDVSLAFSPYAASLDRWLATAREAGHESLLMVPMEPLGYPTTDPGPNTLLASLPAATLTERLHWALSRGEGYVGLVNLMGSRFTADADALQLVFEELDRRGVMFLDARTVTQTAGPQVAQAVGLPFAINDRFVDAEPSRREIDRRLQDLILQARSRGAAVGLVEALPVTLDRLAAWLPTLEAEGVVLAPITAVAGWQTAR